MDKITLKSALAVHNVPVKGQYDTVHVIVFKDIETRKTYAWRTSTPAALNIEVGKYYDVTGTFDKEQGLLMRAKCELSKESDVYWAKEA